MSQGRSCVFPGSFDPVTVGHMDLIRRVAGIYDRVTVTVMVNVAKKGAMDPDTRVALLKKACEGLDNVTVDRWDGLLTAYLKEKGERVVIRGVRSELEFQNERTAAAVNRLLYPEMETLLLPATEELGCVSSSAVRELAAFGGNFSAFVPENIRDEVKSLLKTGK